MKKVIAVVIVVAIIIAGGVLYKTDRDNKNKKASSVTTSASSSAPTLTPHVPSTSNPKPVSEVVQTKTDSKLGQYLADSNGKALYTNNADTANVSKCTGSCLSNWPVYVATATSNALPANVSTFKRSDNTVQYTYKSMPLYYFAGDTQAGQISGNGIESFKLAKP